MKEHIDVTTLGDNLIYGNDYVVGFTGRYHCRHCGCVQSSQSGNYHHNAGCVLLVKELRPEPVFTPVINHECPVINMEHDYRVYRKDGVLTKIECRYCAHCIDLGNEQFVQIPGSDWYIKKDEPGRVKVIPNNDDNEFTFTRGDVIICSVALVVMVIAGLSHWLFGG